ncbi:MAG: CinA family protein [Planctomycetales bacterium]|nr:CinA family protein [Planctomycetales bacterium]
MTGTLHAAAEKLGGLLRERNETVSVAESVTSGHIQAAIGRVSGASDYFLGGITAYALDAKVRLLGVDLEHARSSKCVSPQIAFEMAAGIAQRFGSHWSVSTTGYAELSPADQVDQPSAFVSVWHAPRPYIATADEGIVMTQGSEVAKQHLFVDVGSTASRIENQQSFAWTALELLISAIVGARYGPLEQ